MHMNKHKTLKEEILQDIRELEIDFMELSHQEKAIVNLLKTKGLVGISKTGIIYLINN